MKESPINLQSSFVRAAGSSAKRVLMRHGSKISSAFYIAGNAALILNNGLKPGLDAAAGAMLTASAVSIWSGGKTSAAFRRAGYCTVAGGILLIAAAHGQAGFASQIAGTMPLLVTGSLMAVASDVNKDKSCSEDDGFIRKYPVLSAAIGQALLRPFMFYSGYQRGDWGLMAGALSWWVADIVLGLSDPGVQAKLRARNVSLKPQV